MGLKDMYVWCTHVSIEKERSILNFLKRSSLSNHVMEDIKNVVKNGQNMNIFSI